MESRWYFQLFSWRQAAILAHILTVCMSSKTSGNIIVIPCIFRFILPENFPGVVKNFPGVAENSSGNSIWICMESPWNHDDISRWFRGTRRPPLRISWRSVCPRKHLEISSETSTRQHFWNACLSSGDLKEKKKTKKKTKKILFARKEKAYDACRSSGDLEKKSRGRDFMPRTVHEAALQAPRSLCRFW